MVTLDQPVTNIKYIGEKVATLLKKKGITTVLDLLNYFPYKYENTKNIYSISKVYNYFDKYLVLAPSGKLKLKLCTIGIVEETTLIQPKYKRNIKIIKSVIADEKNPNDKISVIWFNQIHILKTLKKGEKVVLYGDIYKRGSHLEMINPQFELYKIPLTHLGRLTPVYERISKKISPKMIRRYINEIKPLIGSIKEFIPHTLRKEFNILNLADAYYKIHFPNEKQDIAKAYERLAIQEVLEMLASSKKEEVKTPSLFSINPQIVEQFKKYIEEYKKLLPFTLTEDQEKATLQIVTNWAQNKQSVFLYGDVGSGKTVVFFLLALAFGKLGYSSIIMAPTSILATQHYKTFTELLARGKELFDINLMLVTSATKSKKKLVIDRPSIVIGTHALLFRDIDFKSYQPALVAVDEEHKFGIFQREKLKHLNKEGFMPYQLSLSATPIPRTLALSLYGYQEAVYITTKPKGRKTVKSHLVPPHKLDDLLRWVSEQIRKGEQVFFVFPRIEGEEIENFPLTLWYDMLRAHPNLKEIKTGVLHGKMKEAEKNRIIESFRKKEIKLLFTTTIIEVGIDIPTANIMVIFGPEYMGLAQLHQLRGRVGRSDKQAYCFLFTYNTQPSVQNRLHFFTRHNDGIKIAEYDLKNRGPGDILIGTQQHGWRRLKIANLNDYHTLNKAITIFQKLKEERVNVLHYLTPLPLE